MWGIVKKYDVSKRLSYLFVYFKNQVFSRLCSSGN